MRIRLITFGSRGDVQPFVALGLALARTGHDVALLTPEDQVAFVQRAGLATRTLPVDVKATLESPRGQELLAGGRVLLFARMLQQVTAEMLPRVVPAVVDATRDAELLLAHVLMLPYAMVLAEPSRVVRLFTAPLVPTRAWASPLIGRSQAGPFNALSHAVIDRLGWWSARDAARAVAEHVGAPVPRSNCFIDAERAGMLALHFTSPALLPPAQLPAHHVLCGEMRLDPATRARLGEANASEALELFLREGPPPVFFGFGSMPVRDPRATLALVEEVARALDVRALLGAGWSAIAPGPHAGGRVFVTGAFDHDAVLPRCRAAVHHGGAGTTHTALRAGLPAVVCAFMVDQPFWADLLIRKGVGALVPFPELTAARLIAALRPLLTDDARARAGALAQQMQTEHGVDVAVHAIEELGARLGIAART